MAQSELIGGVGTTQASMSILAGNQYLTDQNKIGDGSLIVLILTSIPTFIVDQAQHFKFKTAHFLLLISNIKQLVCELVGYRDVSTLSHDMCNILAYPFSFFIRGLYRVGKIEGTSKSSRVQALLSNLIVQIIKAPLE